MNGLEILVKVWPMIAFLIASILSGIYAHFTQKGRIDVLEQKLDDSIKIIDHLTDAGKTFKKEQEVLKVALGKLESGQDYIIKTMDEIKSYLKDK